MFGKNPFSLGILAAVLVLAALAGLAMWHYGDNAGAKRGVAGQAGEATGSGTPTIGGPFTLTDHTGKKVTDRDFAGKYMLIYFGFTFCPDVCPTELQTMSAALHERGPQSAEIQPIFISIDPDRDTPEVLATYVPQFDPRLTGLTGSPAEIASVAKAYRVYYAKVKDESSAADYSMDHSSVIYLMGPDGKFLTFFGPGVAPEAMAKKIGSYMAKEAPAAENPE